MVSAEDLALPEIMLYREKPIMKVALLPIQHPITFSRPRRIVSSGWIQHTPFAFFLMDLFRPRRVVELGSFSGASYCAFCQAAKTLDLKAQCFAVDTWQGDPHAGTYGEDVLNDLKRHHDPLYSNFSTLLPMSFDEALSHFSDKSIDLLHIDGYHTYEAVKHDFDSWFPKMSNRGIILFHDTHMRSGDFGVWRLWDELKIKYPHFDFLHGSGLGVLFVGEKAPPWFQAIASAPTWELTLFRTLFSLLGKRIDLLSWLKP